MWKEIRIVRKSVTTASLYPAILTLLHTILRENFFFIPWWKQASIRNNRVIKEI